VTIGVVGTGLIGGSIGLGLRSASHRVIGFEANADAAKTAFDRGCVDALGSLEEVSQADVVFICVPPSLIAETAAKVCSLKPPKTIVTDCGSTKSAVVTWLDQSGEDLFVPGHPMAGHEKSGPKFASAWMFRGARWILTPTAFTNKEAVKTIEKLVGELGATPVRLDSEMHDRDVALLSHLPHALAAVLVQMAEKLNSTDASGGSWRDLTRVGGVDPELWMQILTTNRAQVASALNEFRDRLGGLQKALEENNDQGVWQFFEDARAAKEKQS